jgi:cation diffusion facilitator family transporter
MGLTLPSTRIRIAVLSITTSAGILALKWVAYFITGSAALKSDALESIVNVVASFFALGALIYAEQPEDEDHPYGHGKIEHFSSAFEGGLVALAAALILYEGVNALIRGPEVKQLGLGVLINGAAGLANGALGVMLIRQGKRLRSAALSADGHHILSDFITTVVLLGGLGVAHLTGWVWLDGALAIGLGLWLARTGFMLVRSSSAALLDTEDPQLVGTLVDALNKNHRTDIISVHNLRSMRTGRQTHVEAHLVVPEHYSVAQAHELTEAHTSAVMESAGAHGEFTAHVDPCHRAYCASCQVEPCAVRQTPFAARVPYTVASVTRRMG